MTDLSRRMLAWYARHQRKMPWRGHANPYAVWVSEIMLQQTQVVTVIPYFKRWMARFPGIKQLAAASEQEVLGLWEGLGYYSRARNIHRAARILVAQHGGRLPANVSELRKLPGIGRYTAGAIASMAFGRDEPTLDANVRRVLARVFDVRTPADSPAGGKKLWALAAANLPAGRAGDYNQALMDLGATVCLPKNPACPKCPLRIGCKARQRGVQNQRPVLKPRAAVPTRVHAAAVVLHRGRVLLARRAPKGLLGGLWEFPNGAVVGEPASALAAVIKAGYQLKVRQDSKLGIVRHAYTHFKLIEHAFLCELEGGVPAGNLRWAPVGRLADYPMGRADRRIADLFVGK